MMFAPAPSRSDQGRTIKALALSLITIWLVACLAALPARDSFAHETPAQDIGGAAL